MPVATAGKILQISQSDDPKQGILKAVGDLSGIEVLGDLVLVGTYIRPEKTAGGIIRPDRNVDEDEFQGKVGLVLKKGPLAFGDWEEDHYQGRAAEIGSWVMYAIKDGVALQLNKVPCRLVPYARLRMKLNSPEVVF